MSTWRVFDERAENYDRWYDENREIFEAELNCVEETIGELGNKTCIEVGVGTGRFASKLGVIGLDISRKVLEIAKKRGVEVIRGDAGLLPFKKESVDCILLVVTLCFLENPYRVIEEIKTCLRKEGILVVCVIPADSTLGKEYSQKKGPFYSIARFYSFDELRELLKDFRIVNVKGIKIKGENDFVCLKAVKAKR